jgi:hypothetical protein
LASLCHARVVCHRDNANSVHHSCCPLDMPAWGSDCWATAAAASLTCEFSLEGLILVSLLPAQTCKFSSNLHKTSCSIVVAMVIPCLRNPTLQALAQLPEPLSPSMKSEGYRRHVEREVLASSAQKNKQPDNIHAQRESVMPYLKKKTEAIVVCHIRGGIGHNQQPAWHVEGEHRGTGIGGKTKTHRSWSTNLAITSKSRAGGV